MVSFKMSALIIGWGLEQAGNKIQGIVNAIGQRPATDLLSRPLCCRYLREQLCVALLQVCQPLAGAVRCFNSWGLAGRCSKPRWRQRYWRGWQLLPHWRPVVGGQRSYWDRRGGWGQAHAVPRDTLLLLLLDHEVRGRELLVPKKPWAGGCRAGILLGAHQLRRALPLLLQPFAGGVGRRQRGRRGLQRQGVASC